MIDETTWRRIDEYFEKIIADMHINLGVVTSHEFSERFKLPLDFYDDLHAANDSHGQKYFFRKAQQTEGSLFDLQVQLRNNPN